MCNLQSAALNLCWFDISQVWCLQSSSYFSGSGHSCIYSDFPTSCCMVPTWNSSYSFCLIYFRSCGLERNNKTWLLCTCRVFYFHCSIQSEKASSSSDMITWRRFICPNHPAHKCISYYWQHVILESMTAYLTNQNTCIRSDLCLHACTFVGAWKPVYVSTT